VTTTPKLSDAAIAALGFSPQRLQRLHRHLEWYVTEGKHAGITSLLFRKGQVADVFAVGFQDRLLGRPMQPDTIVRTYSLTKIVTSVAALILLEEGKFGLLHPVEEYLPEFRDMQIFVGGTARNPALTPAKNAVTIHQLFTHCTGFFYEGAAEPLDEIYARAGLEEAESLAEYVKILASLPLKREPGTMFEYGYSTDILARLIEVVTGQRLDVFFKEQLLDPLGMADTGFAVEERNRHRLAKVYEHGNNGELQPVGRFDFEVSDGVRKCPIGSAGLFSTIMDYGRFGQMLCNRGELDGVRILGRKTFELMTADHLCGLPVANRTFTEGYSFGLASAVRINNGLAGTLGTLGSFGWSGKATTLCTIDPAEELVMLVFAQHLPYNEHGLFERYTNLVYQALL